MSASQRVVRFRKETQTPASGEEGIKVAGDSSFASSLLQLREQARRQFILRVGNGRAKINSSFPSWRQEDIRNVKGNSSLSLTKYRRRGSSYRCFYSFLTRSFVAASDPLIQLLIISDSDFSRGEKRILSRESQERSSISNEETHDDHHLATLLVILDQKRDDS